MGIERRRRRRRRWGKSRIRGRKGERGIDRVGRIVSGQNCIKDLV